VHDNFFELGKEPTVDFGELKDLFHRETGAEGMADKENPFGIGHAEFLGD